MSFLLGPCAREAGYRLATFETLDSTNSAAMTRARAGDSGCLWIVAREQTEGRGRRGRIWQGAQGNLAASLLLVLNLAPVEAATLGFVAGLALEQALRNCTAGAEFRIKWPNDVLMRGEKLAGILLEAEPLARGLAIVVGIGVNLKSAPKGLPHPATSLAAHGFIVHPELMLAALSDAWIEFATQWDYGAGMGRIRDLWLAKAAGRGEPINVSVGERTVQGVFESLDESGRLILRQDDGVQIAVSAGEVHFGTAAMQSDPLGGRS